MRDEHPEAAGQAMRFDSKIAIAIRSDLPLWQKLNMTAFLASGIASAVPGTIGLAYRDGSGRHYAALFRQPVLVLAGGAEEVAAAFHRARERERDLALAVFVEAMFSTGHDAANRETIADVASPELAPVGFAVHGPRNVVDRALKGLSLHP